MRDFAGRVAVVTGAASGLGLEAARGAAHRGMKVVMADVQHDALQRAVEEVRGHGAEVLPVVTDVSKAESVQALADTTVVHFGVPHLVFNNAGVATGGLIWEHTAEDWEWVVGVNLMGVAHGVRVFTPLMLDAASLDSSYAGHIVNTASMAGLLNTPNLGAYNVTKHAVVSLSETLFQDLALVTEQIHVSVLCPYFIPTGIAHSHRNRPDALHSDVRPTRSQRIAQAMSEKAVSSGRISAGQVMEATFNAIREDQFYIFSHPQALNAVQQRMDDIMKGRNPSNPFAERPELGEQLREGLRAAR
jgi:NAD(P)-dependent dehydrogenase (short-subunit alcohol dehydrogenase family)